MLMRDYKLSVKFLLGDRKVKPLKESLGFGGFLWREQKKLLSTNLEDRDPGPGDETLVVHLVLGYVGALAWLLQIQERLVESHNVWRLRKRERWQQPERSSQDGRQQLAEESL